MGADRVTRSSTTCGSFASTDPRQPAAAASTLPWRGSTRQTTSRLNPPPARPTRVTLDRILVAIPTYNERENLPRIVPQVLGVDPRVSILVVDDGSPDGTGELADGLAGEYPDRAHVLHRTEKEGLGRAYVAGFRWVLEHGYDAICEVDADLSHRPEDLARVLEALTDHDVVIGSRYVGGRVNVVNWPLSRLLISLGGSLYARMVTGLPVRDATGGFNCFRADVLRL